MVSFEFQSWGEGSRPSHGSWRTQARIFVYDTDSDNFLEYQAVGGATRGESAPSWCIPSWCVDKDPLAHQLDAWKCHQLFDVNLMLYGHIVWTTYGL
jgi:hypothetical protein